MKKQTIKSTVTDRFDAKIENGYGKTLDLRQEPEWEFVDCGRRWYPSYKCKVLLLRVDQLVENGIIRHCKKKKKGDKHILVVGSLTRRVLTEIKRKRCFPEVSWKFPGEDNTTKQKGNE